MSSASGLDSEGPISPDWIFINSPDYQSPGHNILTSPGLAITTSSLSNQDFTTHSIAASPHKWIERSTPASPEPVPPESPKRTDLPVPFYGKIEFFCENCIAPPARCTRNSIRNNLMSNTTKFSLLEPEDQVDGFITRRGRREVKVELLNTVRRETPCSENMLRIGMAIATLNSNSRATALAIGYETLDEVPCESGYRWSIFEPFLRRHTSCPYCFMVFVKHELIGA
ncbi:hypothetical protein TWF106_005590 [Orbilia oligospora]|uniref:Uncharacterized protein n=1 Tax=Orbilia oligospora TaxID=2813651 RepID=A0A6G1M2K2_ORBOL|nr:hypothetical protein TWF106_005590 [Orbilia oligospora]KAF3199117.1 hypothetical protein TWF191_004603 [Orbilia oligospora]KAF3201331.1 hypothetical protein TWF679_011391 [Orbilia oligospora]KAF3242828.1 hypothetical protein TWF192_008543 [Orbilia oligospora]